MTSLKNLLNSNKDSATSKTAADAELFNSYNNFLTPIDDNKLPSTQNENFKEEFYDLFYSMQNRMNPNTKEQNDVKDSTQTKIKDQNSIPFSMFDRYHQKNITDENVRHITTPKGEYSGYTVDNNPTFVNNNKNAIMDAPNDFLISKTPSGKSDYNRLATWASNKENEQYTLLSKNLSAINYFTQRSGTSPEAANISSTSVPIHNETEKRLRKIFDTSVRNICKIFNPSSRLSNMALIPQDFAFIKDINKKSFNKLAIVRRYPYPVGNNPLMSKDINTLPISTLVGFVEGDTWASFGLGETWESVSGVNIVEEVAKKAESTFGSNVGAVIKIASDTAFNNTIRKAGYKNPNAAKNIGADPNLITTTMKREAGLDNSFTYEFKTVYEIKYYPGYDLEMVFLDIVGNILSMATSDRISLISPQGPVNLKKLSDLKKAKNTDDVLKQIQKILSDILTSYGETSSTANDTQNKKQNKSSNLVDDFLNTVFSKNEIAFKAQIAALCGLENAPWHLTLGNPMRPYLTMGNMVLERGKLEFKGNLNLVDLPSEIHFSCSLKPATPLGKQDIENILNSGFGRIYNNYVFKQDRSYTRDIEINYSPSLGKSSNVKDQTVNEYLTVEDGTLSDKSERRNKIFDKNSNINK